MPKGLDRETQGMVAEAIGRIRTELLPKEKVLELDQAETFPKEILRALMGPEIGLQLLYIPKKLGGMGGGTADCCALVRGLSKICLGVASSYLAAQLGTVPIMTAGTSQQKKKWLGKIVQGDCLAAHAVTEPQAGSNLAALETRAEPKTDKNGKVTGYLLTGSKQFITNGQYADFYTVLARTPQGPSFFIVESGSKGFNQGKAEKKHGIRSSNTAPLFLKNVPVPKANLVGGKPGLGLKQANQVFGATRLMVAAMALGAMDRLLEIVVPYAAQREQFSKSLAKKQGYTHKLIIPHFVRRAAAEAYLEKTAARMDAGEKDTDTDSAIIKLFATEAANQAADDVMQAMGGYGYISDFEVEKIRRDAKILCIFEGTSEIQQNIISTYRWKKTFQSKGRFYEDLAGQMDQAGRQAPQTGARSLALAARAVNETIWLMHAEKFTRQQALMFSLADMASWVEVGCALAQKAAGLAGKDNALARQYGAMSRIFTAEVCQKAAACSLEAVLGMGKMTQDVVISFMEDIGHDALVASQSGVLRDKDFLANLLFAKIDR